MPTGMDQVFAEECPFYPNGVGILAQALVDVPEGKRRYEERLVELFQRVWKLPEIEKTIDRLQAQIRPALKPEEVEPHAEAVANLKAMIRTQTRRIEAQVAAIKRPGAGAAKKKKRPE